MVEHPRNGGADGGDRLHPRQRPTNVGSAERAAIGVGPRVGRHRAGAVAGGLSVS